MHNMTDKALLTRLEARVDQGLTGTGDALCALLQIRSQGLYRLTHTDFWAYCKARWPRHERTIQRLLAAEKIAAEVTAPESSSSPKRINDNTYHGPRATQAQPFPKPNERQARELNRLPDAETRRQVWVALVRTCETLGQRLTARHVASAVDEYLATEAGEEPSAEEVLEGEEEVQAWVDQEARQMAVEEIKRAIIRIERMADQLPHAEEIEVERWLSHRPDFLAED